MITITDSDVLREYRAETGGPDTGLVVLDSLKEWRTKGWLVAQKRYKIKAFAQVNQAAPDELKMTRGIPKVQRMPPYATRQNE